MADVKEAEKPDVSATNGKSNGTSSSAPLTAADAEVECKRQIEFYFSDANLPYDKFLFLLTKRDADGKDSQGWVPIAQLKAFKRMRDIVAALDSDEKEQIAKIAKIMRTSEDVEVNEAGDKVRRTRPLVRPSDSFQRSIYAKGFPDETETSQQELEKYFQQFGKINVVRMRRDMESKEAKKPFKNSVFVEFADLNEMNTFLDKAKGEDFKYNGTPLKIMSKQAYCDMKMEEKNIDPKSLTRGQQGNKAQRKFNAFQEMDRHAKGLPSVFSEGEAYQGRRDKRKEAEDRKQRAHEGRSKPLEFEFMEKKISTQADGTVNPEDLAFPAQSVLAFTGAGQGGNWRDLKDTLVTMHPTSFVEFPNGATEGAVGFKSSVDDEKYNQIVNMGINVGGQQVKWTRVDEERAKKFYLDRANFRAGYLIDQREQREADGGHSSGGGGQRQGGGGRGGGNHASTGRGGKGGRGGGGRNNNAENNKRKRDAVAGKGDEDVPPEVVSSAAKKAKVIEA